MKRVVAWLALCCCAPLLAAEPPATQDFSAWPAITQTARPWTRWWWPGSAVDRENLSAELRALADAGIGGVEITPIYGARGAEARDIPYLSPRWVEMLGHVGSEARNLGLGVDMATGTGWPFGGPSVSPADASSSLQFAAGKLSGKPTGMKVKRPAPGGEGLVLDPYSMAALDRYLAVFTPALAPLPRGAVRSQFHDSFEYFNASWSAGLPAKFREMHGYDIQDHAAEIAGEKPLDADTLSRIKGDYRRTLAALHLDYVRRWVQWSHSRGFQARNQAHGAPGALLDLYGITDIPETESFGSTRMGIAGLRQDPADISEDTDPPVNLIGRFASSAAHVMGRPLVSSETLTWLRENFREYPAAAKPQLDRLFVAGINHVFYHGTSYSPADAAWPGWFFYAATQLNARNPLWRDLQGMHAYVTRVQSVLQAGRPDNDLLLYWPEADVMDVPEGLMRQQTMHDNAWLVQSEAGKLALQLLEAGYSFDFISDAQLQALRAEKRGAVIAPGGGRYAEILIPKTRRMPVETLQKLWALHAEGAHLTFHGALPEDVPGFGRLAERRASLAGLRARFESTDVVARLTPAVTLEKSAVTREEFPGRGLWFTRRARAGGFDYFVVNPTDHAVREWVHLGRAAAQVWLLDPLSGEAGVLAQRPGLHGRPDVRLQLASGESLILRTFDKPPRQRPPGLRPRAELRAKNAGKTLAGPWTLEFLYGGPELPAAATLATLRSWTDLADANAARFSGTARYRLEFELPADTADDWQIALGDVRETARVTVNGQHLGTVWSLPATLRIGRALRPGRNLLEIEVTNLPANRVRDLDRRRVDWKVMKDINLASLRYRALDASTWEPVPSGLLGPVTLVPLQQATP